MYVILERGLIWIYPDDGAHNDPKRVILFNKENKQLIRNILTDILIK